AFSSAGVVGNLAELLLRRGPLLLGQMIDHVSEPMIPAALLRAVREDLAQRRPDPQVSIGHRDFPRPQPASKKIAQQPRPRFLRFPLSAFNRQHYFAPVPQGAHDHLQRGLLSSRPAFTYRPSAQAYTISRLSSRRLRHASNSSCHFARSRSIAHAQSGPPSPSSPHNASSKSPWASPWR